MFTQAGLFAVEREGGVKSEDARDAAGRRLRKDAPVLLAGVATYPARSTGMSDGVRTDYLAWEVDTIAWLRQRYGDRLQGVVRHEDEAFVHIHFLVVPDFESGERMEAIHPGRAAAKAAKDAKADAREQNRRYRAAMRSLQDDFFQAVSVRHGLAALPDEQREVFVLHELLGFTMPEVA